MMEFDIEKILKELAKERPVFHNESDFQFCLALKIKEIYPSYEIRLEKFFGTEREIVNGRNQTIRKYIDIIVADEPSEKYIAIELKYKTKGVQFNSFREEYDLQDHGAQDYGSYAVLADVERIETLRRIDKFYRGFHFEKGYSIIISNDRYYEKDNENNLFSSYWLTDGKIINKGKLDFVIPQGKTQNQTCAKGFKSICLEDDYKIEWKQYSNIMYDETDLPTHSSSQKAFKERRSFRCAILTIQNKKDL